MNRGKYSKAQNLCGWALDILENIFDEYHPSVADVLKTLVQLHRKTGNMMEVVRLEQRVEEIRVHKLYCNNMISLKKKLLSEAGEY